MKETFIIERYRYVLDQKKRLNETTFKVSAFFQTLILVIFSGQFHVVELAQKKEISSELAQLGTFSLFGASVALAAVSVLLIIGGIASWFDYRNEEVVIEELLTGVRGRPPSLKGVLRWYETYIVAIMAASCPVYFLVIKYAIIPIVAS